MQNIASILRESREHLLAQTSEQRWDCRVLAAHLESLASMFSRTSKDQHRELIAQFHDCAGKLPYVDDCDYGALVLENVAEAAGENGLRVFLLREAQFRATWCVQAASAGGEAMARAVHLKRLDQRIQNAN